MIKRMIRKMIEKVSGTHPCLMYTGTGLLPRIKLSFPMNFPQFLPMKIPHLK